jgi:negative regulator of flagellin synthesis FlgM
MISKIKDTSTTLIQQYQKADSAKTEADKQIGVQVGVQAGVAEKVNLSAKAKDIQQIRQLLAQIPDTRETKVIELKNQVDSGTYRIEAGKIAEKMVGESLIDLFA